jgi:hypothetical protein
MPIKKRLEFLAAFAGWKSEQAKSRVAVAVVKPGRFDHLCSRKPGECCIALIALVAHEIDPDGGCISSTTLRPLS